MQLSDLQSDLKLAILMLAGTPKSITLKGLLCPYSRALGHPPLVTKGFLESLEIYQVTCLSDERGFSRDVNCPILPTSLKWQLHQS